VELAGVDVESVVARLWPGREATLDVLGGGITNHNVKVDFGGGEAYVLRIAGENTGLLGIDRLVEHEASLAAAAVGVGPEVVTLLEPEQWLVTEFIDGSIVAESSMREDAQIRRVAAALRAVHAGPPLARRFDSFQIVEDYRTIAFGHGAAVPAQYVWARQVARRIETARGATPERPCHNDLLNANFIDDGSSIRIVDWEYAGMGDVFFDLANFSINHGFGRDEHLVLLEAYTGGARPQDERALELMRFMSDFREAMWGVVQGAISGLEFDFEGYANRHFERLEAIAGEPGFEDALARA
jgi:thiamine kinase-like enzyme